jgi:hypothetical protein
LTHVSCRRCGIRLFARGGPLAELGGTFHAIHVVTLDGLEPAELAAAPVKAFDGRHDRWDRSAEDANVL